MVTHFLKLVVAEVVVYTVCVSLILNFFFFQSYSLTLGGGGGLFYGGGGGSSYAHPNASGVTFDAGFQDGHGYVAISACSCPGTPTLSPTPLTNSAPSTAFSLPPSSCTPVEETREFFYTGLTNGRTYEGILIPRPQEFVLPACAEYVRVDAIGARGGDAQNVPTFPTGPPGLGARVVEDYLPVTRGSTLYVVVGGHGVDGDVSFPKDSGGQNGGGNAPQFIGTGGGGASDGNYRFLLFSSQSVNYLFYL